MKEFEPSVFQQTRCPYTQYVVSVLRPNLEALLTLVELLISDAEELVHMEADNAADGLST